jgi:hypothetical protein
MKWEDGSARIIKDAPWTAAGINQKSA